VAPGADSSAPITVVQTCGAVSPKRSFIVAAVNGWVGWKADIGRLVRHRRLCAHQGRSDKRHRFSRAVVHGGSGKWLGWVEAEQLLWGAI